MADVYEPEYPSGAGAGRAREPEPPVTGRSPVEVIKDIVGNIQEIFRAEIRLARAEVTEKLRQSSRAGILVGAGAVIGFYALAFGLVAVYTAISIAVWPWLSALIICAALGIAAVTLLAVGIGQFRKLNPKPERTVASVRENVEWVKNRMK